MGRIKASVAEKSASKLAKADGMHAMGGVPGLYLHVRGGSRSWVLRYSFEGRRRDLGLGSYIDLTLAEARERAREQRKLIVQGIDPIDAKRDLRDERMIEKSRRMTFQQCVDGYLDAHGDAWKNPKHRAQYRATLETYACPVIGSMNVANVCTELVVKILDPIWKIKTETATRLRGRIENVLSWATVRGYRHGDNPARWRGHLDQLLAKPSKVATVSHHAALHYTQIGAFMMELRQQKGIGASALEFAILTACRSGEVRGAAWDEFDQAAKVWAIPGTRMKAGREHTVPLSDAALAVIARMQGNRLDNFVFPGAKEGRPLSDMSMGAVLRRMNRGDLTQHGFRSTFRDWCAEQTAYPHEMAEMALAHTIGNKTEAAYRRGDLLEKRRRMMADWATRCATPDAPGKVVAMRKASA